MARTTKGDAKQAKSGVGVSPEGDIFSNRTQEKFSMIGEGKCSTPDTPPPSGRATPAYNIHISFLSFTLRCFFQTFLFQVSLAFSY